MSLRLVQLGLSLFLNFFFHKGPICTPNAVQCYDDVSIANDKCMLPCKGLYADINVDYSDMRSVEEIEKLDKLLRNYDEYKRAYFEDIVYPAEIKG